jgi:hypothetical protein
MRNEAHNIKNKMLILSHNGGRGGGDRWVAAMVELLLAGGPEESSRKNIA